MDQAAPTSVTTRSISLRAGVHVRCRPVASCRSPHPDFERVTTDRRRFQGASLDHAIWFHRHSHPDEWHWFDTRSHGLFGARGLITGDVLNEHGVHVATIAQEVLLRRRRGR